MKRKSSNLIFAAMSCGLIVLSSIPIHDTYALSPVNPVEDKGEASETITYSSNIRMEEVPVELLDNGSTENIGEGSVESTGKDSTENTGEGLAESLDNGQEGAVTGSPRAGTEVWRIDSSETWANLMTGGKTPVWSGNKYTGTDNATIILEADIVTDTDAIYLAQEGITFTLDLNGHSFQSRTGRLGVNSVNDAGGKRLANTFVLCNGRIVNTCIDTSNAMKNVDIHEVDFTDMNTEAVSGNSSAAYSIDNCSFTHVAGANSHTAVEVHSSGAVGQPIRISGSKINGFETGVNCNNNSHGVVLNNITVQNAFRGVVLSGSPGSKITNSVLSGNRSTGSLGVNCTNAGSSIRLNDFLYNNQSDMSGVMISDFETGVINSGGAYSIHNCKITDVNSGLNATNTSASFLVRDSILSANPVVAEGSYTGNSYGIYAAVGYYCVNTEVTGFQVGAWNSTNTSCIANCTFDNLNCNVNAYHGGIYNSVLKNAAVGFENGGNVACIIDTTVIGRRVSGSIGIHEPVNSHEMHVLDTDTFSPDGLHSDLDTLVAYVRSAYPDAVHHDMCVSGYETGLQCDGSQIQIADIEVKNCGTGIKGTTYVGYQKNGVDGISDNYIHDCNIGVDVNVLYLYSNMYIYNCSQAGMQIHNQLTQPHLVEIYNCGEGLVLDGNTITGPHLRIHDNTGNGLSYTGSSSSSMVNTTMEIYNNKGWNIYADNINMLHLSCDRSREFTCRLENGGLGNINLRQRGDSGSSYMLNVSRLESDDSVYYVYPGKELCINPQSDGSWTGPTDWLQGSMVFDTEDSNYTVGAVAAYVPPTYIRTISDQQKDTWDFVRTHFFAEREGWIIQYDISATAGMVGPPLVFAEGCNVTYDYETNGGTGIESDYTKITHQAGDSIDLSIPAVRPGYEFIGWNTSPDAHEALSALTAQRENITLYAVYRKAVTFTYHTYDPALDYTQGGYLFNQETIPYADLTGSRRLYALSYAEQVPDSYYVWAGYSYDGRDKTNLFKDGVISSGGQTDIYCVYVMNGVLNYLKPDGAVDHRQPVESFYTIFDTLPYQFSYVLDSFRPEKGYVFNGWRDAEGRIYAPGGTYMTTLTAAELQAEVTPVLISALQISPKHTTIYTGDTLQMSVVTQPEEVWNSTLTWTTSDASIATIDANGLVTAHREGTVTITVTANDGSGCFDTATVVVVKKGASSQPRTGDDFRVTWVLLLGCLTMLMAVPGISGIGKKRVTGK